MGLVAFINFLPKEKGTHEKKQKLPVFSVWDVKIPKYFFFISWLIKLNKLKGLASGSPISSISDPQVWCQLEVRV